MRFLPLGATAVGAQGQLNILCSVPVPWCEAVVARFQKDTGIKVGMAQRAAGEAMAQFAAEKANPKYDLWNAGSGDMLLLAFITAPPAIKALLTHLGETIAPPTVAPYPFELVVNVKTAKALDLTIPQAVLLRADAVIE